MKDLQNKLAEFSQLITEKSSELHPLQLRIIEHDLSNIEHALSTEESFVSLGSTKFLMWEYCISAAQNRVRAIATNRGTKTGHGFSRNQKLVDIQDTAIQRGVQVQRVFSVDKESYEDFNFFSVARSQLDIGIEVYLAHKNAQEYITSHQEFDQENYVIIDDTLLYRSYVEDGDSKNAVTLNPELIARYGKMFDNLLIQSHKLQKEELPLAYEDI